LEGVYPGYETWTMQSLTQTAVGGGQTRSETGTQHDARSILARLDRLDVWSMPFLFVGIIGLGFLFTFYDVFDINVSFIQTCVALKHGCTPANALGTLRVPVALNLAGYVLGTLLLSPQSDRFGRRNMLLVTMILTGIGSLWTAFAPDYTNFVLARVLNRDGGGRRPVARQHLRRRGRAAP
jgi:MFS transporter, putative metabolite:H+ symporter